MTAEPGLLMGMVTDRLLAALNAHDLDAFVDCFAADYHSEQPAHPARTFVGSDKVRAFTDGHTIERVHVVPRRLVNIVVK